MTTEIQAKRTPGEAVRDGTICAPRKLEIDLRLDDEGDHWITIKGPNAEANAEYIRKAWNMHEELVGWCQSTIEALAAENLSKMDMFEIVKSGNTLLAKAQPK